MSAGPTAPPGASPSATSRPDAPDAAEQAGLMASPGPATRVRAYATLRPGAVVGAGCDIGEGVVLEEHVIVGDRVVIGAGARLGGPVWVGDDVHVGPNATFSGDPAGHEPYPHSPSFELRFGRTEVHSGAHVGAGATVLPGLSIGAHAIVGPGAVVTTPVPAYAIVAGNPARITGYVHSDRVEVRAARAGDVELPPLRARGARLCLMPTMVDARGVLSFGQVGAHLPFTPARYFLVTDVPEGKVRGEHAHWRMEELVVCVKGSFRVVLDDGRVRDDVLLDSPSVALYIPPRVWRIPYAYSPDAVLLALASSIYEPEDYIRDYRVFLDAAAAVDGAAEAGS